MKVELRTKDKAVRLMGDETAVSLNDIDVWLDAIRVARAWLKRELEKKS